MGIQVSSLVINLFEKLCSSSRPAAGGSRHLSLSGDDGGPSVRQETDDARSNETESLSVLNRTKVTSAWILQ